MTKEEWVASILTDSVTAKIDFHLENLWISGAGFARVSRAISDGKIKVIVYAKEDSAAQYYAKRNTLVIRELSEKDKEELSTKGLLVHEAVHAIVDIDRCAKTTKVTTEAAAYLAQVIFLIGHGDTNFSSSKRVFQAAAAIVNRYKMRSRVVWLPRTLYEPLRQAVLTDSLYKSYLKDSDLETDADGV